MSGQRVEEFVQAYGEKYRQLIIDSLAFLDDREPKWGVKIDRDEYIQDLISNAKISEKP
jgi:hypothetical protein